MFWMLARPEPIALVSHRPRVSLLPKTTPLARPGHAKQVIRCHLDLSRGRAFIGRLSLNRRLPEGSASLLVTCNETADDSD